MGKFVTVFFNCLGYFAVWSIFLCIGRIVEKRLPPGILADSFYLEIYSAICALLATVLVTMIYAWLIDKGTTRSKLSIIPGRDMLRAALIGALWVGGVLGLSSAIGLIEFSDTAFDAGKLIWLLPIALNVTAQEYVFRGYLYTYIERSYGAVAAAAAPTLIYLALHPVHLSSGVIATLNVVGASLMYAMLRSYSGGILAPIIVHFVWNAAGGLLFGNVMLGDYPSIFNDVLAAGAVLNDNALGFEGSAIALLVTALLIDFISILIEDKNNPDVEKMVYFRSRGEMRLQGRKVV